MSNHNIKRMLSTVFAVLVCLNLCMVFVSADTPESEADISEPTAVILKGDMNIDGEVNMKDVWAMRWYISGMIDSKGVFKKVGEAWQKWLDEHGNPDFTLCFLKAGDMDGDGDVDMKDVLFLRQYIVGLFAIS